MAQWNIVNCDFAGEETFNFGPREESGLALFDIETLATISADGEVKSKPLIRGSVCKNWAVVSIDQHISLFQDGCYKFLSVLEFENVIETCAWSYDQNVIFTAEKNGKIRMFYIPRQQEIFTKQLNIGDTRDQTFLESVITPPDDDGFCHYILLASNERIYYVSNIQINTLSEVMDYKGLPSFEDFTSSLKFGILDLSSYHMNVTSISSTRADEIYTAGTGSHFIIQWNYDVTNEWALSNAITTGGTIFPKIKQIIFVENEEVLLLLDNKGDIYVFDMDCFCILKRYRGVKIQEMYLLEGCGRRENTISVCVIQILEHEMLLRVAALNDLNNPFYSLKVQSPSYLLKPIIAHDDAVFFVESDDNDKTNFFKSLRVRALTESRPEEKLSRYLNKKMFAEAEDLARQYTLDLEIVYDVHCRELLEKLSPWNSVAPEEAINLFSQLLEKMTHIQSEDSLITFTEASLPSFEMNSKLLNFIENKLKSASSKLSISVLETMYRLTTFKMCNNEYDANEWSRWKGVDIYEEIAKCFREDKLKKAYIIWNRHEREINESMPENGVSALLAFIPSKTKISELSSWLSNHFIPFVIRSRPESIEHVAKFIYEKACELESNETQGWPNNAIDACNILLELLPKLANSYSAASNSLSLCYSAHFHDEKLEDVQDSVVKLKLLWSKLTKVKDLREKYQCNFSLSQYRQETKESIVFKMLDDIQAIELIPTCIFKRLRTYTQEHSLKLDKVLMQYIEYISNREGYSMHIGISDTPWEAKCIAIINCIDTIEYKIKAVMGLVHSAAVPWSAEMACLVHSSLRLDHPEIEELRKECELAELKVVLHKYNIHQLPKCIEISQMKLWIKKIIHSDQGSALSDALKLVKCYGIVDVESVYRIYTVHLISDFKLQEFWDFIKNNSVEVSTCALRTAITCSKRKQTSHTTEQYNELRKAIFIAITFVLKMSLENADRMHFEDYLEQFNSSIAIQKNFDENPEMNDIMFENKRLNFLEMYVENITSKDCSDLSWHKVKRFADALGLRNQNKVHAQIVEMCVRTGNINEAVNLCNRILEYEKNPFVADSLVPLPKIIITYVCDHESLVSECPDLLDKLQKTVSTLACQCNQFMLSEVSKINEPLTLASLISSYCMSIENLNSSLTFNPETYFDHLHILPSCVLDFESVMPLLYEYLNAFYHADFEVAIPVANKILDLLIESKHFWLIFSFGLHISRSRSNFAGSSARDVSELETFMKKTAMALFSKVMNNEPVDLISAVCLLKHLSDSTVKTVIKQFIEGCGINFKKILQTCLVVKNYLKFTDSEKGTHLAQANLLEKNANWGLRLEAMNVNFKEVFYENNDAKRTLLKPIIEHKQTDINLITDYCRAFQLNLKAALFSYVEHLLIDGSLEALDDVHHIIDHVLSHVPKEELYERVKAIFKKMDSYDYGKLIYALKLMNKLKKSESTEKHLLLLDYLSRYERISSPHDVEDLGMDMGILESSLPLNNSTKLPFHAFLSSERKKSIIVKEVNFNTLELWMKTAKLIAVEEDVLMLRAITNELNKIKATKKTKVKSLWEGDRMIDDEFFNNLENIIMQIKDFKKSSGSLNWICKQLQNGYDRVIVLEIALKLAEVWKLRLKEGTNKDLENDVNDMRKEYINLWRYYATLQALYEHQLGNLTEGESKNLQPLNLLLKLYEHPSVTVISDKSNVMLKMIHEAAKRISEIHKVDLKKLKLKLLSKWLSEKGADSSGDGIQAPFECLSTTRIAFLLNDENLHENIEHLLAIAFKDNSYKHRQKVRAIDCLYVLIGRKSLETRSGLTEDVIRKRMNTLYYLQCLEHFNIPHTEESFNRSDKESLAIGIVRNHANDANAVTFAAEFCFHFNIYQHSLWNFIIERLCKFGMHEHLHGIVTRLNNIPRLSNFIQSDDIRNILLSPLTTAGYPLDDRQLEKCMISLEVFCSTCLQFTDKAVKKVMQVLKSLKLNWCAVYCSKFACEEDRRREYVDDAMADLSAPEIIQNYIKADSVCSKKWTMFDANEMKEIVFDYVDRLKKYHELVGTEYMNEFALFLSKKDRLIDFMIFGVQQGRIEDVIRLCKLHSRFYPDAFNVDLGERQMLKEFFMRKGYESIALSIEIPDPTPRKSETDSANDTNDSIIQLSPKLEGNVHPELVFDESDCEWDG
ncbi:DgyrCDS3442 [Dimorphilus gyrociliatus]|uniref:DgyrCDS3442 n=1 Tax=Dimorphilus gyrociliatus TaxID=2664684 RepID=A0A7I8VEB8_9ANNE|nr:DgyrCDS3442 [Dimorphilus gyrociliatus]